MDRYFVTGAAGNLGRFIVTELVSRGHEVMGTDLASARLPGTPKIEIHGIDLRDTEAMKRVIQDFAPRVIIHMASLLSTSSEADPSAAWEVNASASFRLLQVARDLGCERFFYPGTGASYGGVLPDPLPEDFPQWPGNVYGVTKIAIERAGHYFSTKEWLDFRVIRFPMVISPYAPKGAVSAYASHAFVAAVRGEDFVFPVSRDLSIASVFVKDAVLGVLNLMSVERDVLSRTVYNMHGFAPTAGDIASAIEQRVPGFSCRFTPDDHIMSILGPLPSVHQDDLARADWGWSPVYGLDETADSMISLARAL